MDKHNERGGDSRDEAAVAGVGGVDPRPCDSPPTGPEAAGAGTAGSSRDQAFALSSRGFHVFSLDHPEHLTCLGLHGPSSPCDGQRGKHPAVKWSSAATRDAEDIGRMFNGEPRNIGIACGPSGLLVIDEDAPGELERFASSVKETVPGTYTVATGRGRHYYFAQPPGTPLGNSRGDLRDYKLDVRGVGGYVVAPGSVHQTGAVYTAEDPQVPIAELPAWLKAALSLKEQAKPRRAAGEPHGEQRAPIPYGDRHRELVSYAGRLRARGLDFDEARVLFERRWRDCVQPPGAVEAAQHVDPRVPHPVPWSEALATLEDVFQRYPPGRHPDEPAGFAGFGDVSVGVPDEEWPALLPLRPELPELPLHRLPAGVRDLVSAVAMATQTPPDVAWVMALAAVSTASGGMWQVRAHPGWVEALSFYGIAAVPSGTRKSAVLKAVARPLFEVEQQLAARVRPAIVQELTRREVLEEQVRNAKRAAARAPGDKRAEAKAIAAAQQFAALGDPPAEPRLLVEDITAERLALVMAEQGGSIGVLSAEATILHTLVDRYSDSPNVDLLLKAHPGEPYLVDRVGRPSVHLPRTHLALGLAIQPVILDHLGARKLLLHNGFLPRFVFALPRNPLGTRLLHPPPVPPQAEAVWDRQLAALVHAGRGKRQSGIATLVLSDCAVRVLDDFRARLEPRLHPARGDLAEITEWASKLPGTLVRIAALTTLLADPEAQQVSVTDMTAAVGLADYLIAHAREAYRRMEWSGRSQVTETEAVLRWFRAKKLRSFTTRDAYQGVRGQAWANDTAAVQRAIDALKHAGYVRARSDTPTEGSPEHSEPRARGGRPASPRWTVHPALVASDEAGVS